MKSSINGRVGRRVGRMVASSAWVVLGLGLLGGARPAGATGEASVASTDVAPAFPVAPEPVSAAPVVVPPVAPASAPAPAPEVMASGDSDVGSDGVPPTVTADREPGPGRVQQVVSGPPRPEAVVGAIPAMPVKLDQDGAAHDRGFPASALQLGGGMSEFSLGQMRAEAARGPYWDLRAVLGLRRFLSFEAALVGAAYPMDGARYGSGATLLRNGFEVGPRLNIPIEEKAGLILLYGTAGLGWSNYRVVGAQMPGAMVASDFAATLPLAAGITFGYERFLVDVRFGYRLTFQDELLSTNASPAEENRLRDVSVGAQLGYEF